MCEHIGLEIIELPMIEGHGRDNELNKRAPGTYRDNFSQVIDINIEKRIGYIL